MSKVIELFEQLQKLKIAEPDTDRALALWTDLNNRAVSLGISYEQLCQLLEGPRIITSVANSRKFDVQWLTPTGELAQCGPLNKREAQEVLTEVLKLKILPSEGNGK